MKNHHKYMKITVGTRFAYICVKPKAMRKLAYAFIIAIVAILSLQSCSLGYVATADSGVVVVVDEGPFYDAQLDWYLYHSRYYYRYHPRPVPPPPPPRPRNRHVAPQPHHAPQPPHGGGVSPGRRQPGHNGGTGGRAQSRPSAPRGGGRR